MSADFKPGDVAMVKCSDGVWRRAFCGEAKFGIGVAPSWMFPDHSLRYVEDSTARPLVVIDPEDREQVERLRASLEEMSFSPWACGAATCLTTALREFAAPTPPKPEEPTGLGAVVEDADDHKWVRCDESEENCDRPWHNPLTQGAAQWSNIPAVRVLSEGVQP